MDTSHKLSLTYRMMAVQLSRVSPPWILSLFSGVLILMWPLAPAGETSKVSNFLSSLLFLILIQNAAKLPPAEAFQLPLCQLVNQTVSLEKEGCPRCHSVETTICSGHCFTKVLLHLKRDTWFSHSRFFDQLQTLYIFFQIWVQLNKIRMRSKH